MLSMWLLAVCRQTGNIHSVTEYADGDKSDQDDDDDDDNVTTMTRRDAMTMTTITVMSRLIGWPTD